ncbi:MAG: sulfatase-like hydrolase/transferase [Isosphaeraceae bacterium]
MSVVTHDVSLDSTVGEPVKPPDGNPGTTLDQGLRKSNIVVSDVLLTTIWLALVAGFVEGLYWFVLQQLTGAMVFQHPGFLWMSPLTQMALVLVPGIVLGTLAWLSSPARVLPFAVALSSPVGWLNSLELTLPGLQVWSWFLLAAGLAMTTRRLFERYTDFCLRAVRRTTGWMVLLILLIALAQAFGAWWHEASAVAALPDSPRKAPNVLLVVLDTFRADALWKEGAPHGIAPNLARIAEQGVSFTSACSTAPWTLPSHAGMFTGRSPRELSADWLSRLDETYPTLAGQLAARGWLTGGFVGNMAYCSAETGLGRGFCHYEDYRLSWADLVLCTALGRRLLLITDIPVRIGFLDWPGRKRAKEVTGSFLRWLKDRPKRPFFAFLNYFDAHDPYLAPATFRSHEPADIDEKILLRYWLFVRKNRISRGQVAMLHTAYEECIRELDHDIGDLFKQLETRGELENTLIIITADHGEHFGEHELFLHGNSLYEPLLHVPLILVWPGKIPAGIQVDTPVSLQGLPKTVCEMLGQKGVFSGSSWVRYWTTGHSESTQSKPIFGIASQPVYPPCQGRSPVAAGAMRCVRVGMIKYIQKGDGSEELYDLARDGAEENNLARDPQHSTLLERMRKELGPVQANPRSDTKSGHTPEGHPLLPCR